jgi:hypothetical protein
MRDEFSSAGAASPPFTRRAEDQPPPINRLAAEDLPEPATDFGRPNRIVAPDAPPQPVETNDRTITHNVCETSLVVPQGVIDNANNGGTIYCPACRGNFPIDQWTGV